MPKKLTTDEFIDRAKKVHGDKYDYSNVNYIDAKTPVCIICRKHGDFWQKPFNHLSGKGCPQCKNEKTAQRCRKNTEQFINKAVGVHGDKYDYSKVEYIDAHTKVCIMCPVHGEFWQTPNNHLSGYGCKKCAMDNLEANKPRGAEWFIQLARKTHGNKYDYSKVYYVNCKEKVCIICPKHGEFWQTPDNHIRGTECPMCRESKLEREVMSVLNEHGIDFVYDKTKKWLNGKRLDFYLPKYNVAIECQGIQHFKPTDFGGRGSKHAEELFTETKKSDKFKKEKCKENGVKLLYYSNIDVSGMITDTSILIEAIYNDKLID